MVTRRMPAILGLCAALSAPALFASNSPETASPGLAEGFLPPLPQPRQWVLAWSDEFNGTVLDQSKWDVMGDWKRRDGYWVKEDCYLDGNGNLVIRTKKDANRYTSGALRTRDRFEHRFGYWVCRCKFPTQPGHWPAFWLHCDSVVKIGNQGRDGTEIDIMEKPWREDRITQNLHWDGYGQAHKHAGKESTIPGISDGFHTFALHWTPLEYTFYVDGKQTWRTNAGGVSQVPQYAKLTEEIGKWGGDITKAKLPDYFVVDYVRVYDAVDSDNRRAKQRDLLLKAVNVRPHPRQLAWQQGEFICFIHFGVNTFTGREWGTGTEDPRIFNPEALDTDQWCRQIKAAGMTEAILTVKHHDGFCLWQTRYTGHSVASSDWRAGKGDVLAELARSCKKFGLKLGIYLSPADLYQIESPDGLYGNLSEYSERVIPRPVPGRPFKDKRSFKFVLDDYNEYFMNQLFELLTEYGPVHEVWFDGAHPKRKGGQKYTYQHWYTLIRELAPQAVIFGKGPDVRWCGNEAGRTRAAEWSVIPISAPPGEFDWPDMTAEDLGSFAKLLENYEKGGYLHWYPAETNTSIRRGWFWRDQQQHVKSAREILDIWYRSVGGNTVFLLNVPPNRQGLFAQRDSEVLRQVGRILRETFETNLAQGATAAGTPGRAPGFEPARALDGNPDTCWMPSDWTVQAELVVSLPAATTFNRVVFQENIGHFGQRIARFAVDALTEDGWAEIAEGRTVGYKKICRTKTVTAKKVRVRVQDCRVCPTISTFALYNATAP